MMNLKSVGIFGNGLNRIARTNPNRLITILNSINLGINTYKLFYFNYRLKYINFPVVFDTLLNIASFGGWKYIYPIYRKMACDMDVVIVVWSGKCRCDAFLIKEAVANKKTVYVYNVDTKTSGSIEIDKAIGMFADE